MRRELIIVFLGTVLVTMIVWSIQRGCGAALSAIFEFLGWRLVEAVFGSVFSDTHVRTVSLVGAALNGICITSLLALGASVARRRGYLLSEARLAVTFAAGTVLYLALILLAFPIEKCP